MNPMQAPNCGPGGEDFGCREPTYSVVQFSHSCAVERRMGSRVDWLMPHGGWTRNIFEAASLSKRQAEKYIRKATRQ